MAYPPLPHTERDPVKILQLMRDFPFAHIFTSGADGHQVTRLPFLVDETGGEIHTLRAHMNTLNPQRAQLENGDTLVSFSGPHSYVSPNWRIDKGRGGTWDYTAVHVWGKITVRPEKAFFENLINDLSNLVEPAFDEVSNASIWQTQNAPPGYIDRLHPHLTAFEIKVTKITPIAKLHQDFPDKDARSVAKHLEKSDKPDSQIIAKQIKSRLQASSSNN